VPETNATDADARDGAGHRLEFFGSVADRIVRELRPRRVLDAGCGDGTLVEQLHDRGVEAHGVDISEYAISKVGDVVQDQCVVASLIKPIDGCYDLITCIDVLEHVPPSDVRVVLDNLCRATRRILLSPAPWSDGESGGLEVHTPGHWSSLLADKDFQPEPAYDASYLAPGAALYVRTPVRSVNDPPLTGRVRFPVVSSPNSMAPGHRSVHDDRAQGRPYEALLRRLSPKTVLMTGGDDRAELIDEIGDWGADVHVVDIEEFGHQAPGDEHAAGRFDLVVLVASPELRPDEPRRLVPALAAAADVILLVPGSNGGPADPLTAPHAVEWSSLLADRGMFRDVTHASDDLPPSALLYRRSQLSPAELVRLYERALYDVTVDTRSKLDLLDADRQQLRKEILRVRDLAFGRQAELASATARVEELDAMLARYDNLEHRLKDVLDSRSWRMTQTIGLPLRKLRGLR
jgi:SAM-dependent methyltransferase